MISVLILTKNEQQDLPGQLGLAARDAGADVGAQTLSEHHGGRRAQQAHRDLRPARALVRVGAQEAGKARARQEWELPEGGC